MSHYWKAFERHTQSLVRVISMTLPPLSGERQSYRASKDEHSVWWLLWPNLHTSNSHASLLSGGYESVTPWATFPSSHLLQELCKEWQMATRDKKPYAHSSSSLPHCLHGRHGSNVGWRTPSNHLQAAKTWTWATHLSLNAPPRLWPFRKPFCNQQQMLQAALAFSQRPASAIVGACLITTILLFSRSSSRCLFSLPVVSPSLHLYINSSPFNIAPSLYRLPFTSFTPVQPLLISLPFVCQTRICWKRPNLTVFLLWGENCLLPLSVSPLLLSSQSLLYLLGCACGYMCSLNNCHFIGQRCALPCQSNTLQDSNLWLYTSVCTQTPAEMADESKLIEFLILTLPIFSLSK